MRITKPLLLAVLMSLGQGCQTPTLKEYPSAGNQVIANALRPIAQKHSVPALAGAIVTDSGEVWLGVVGMRNARGGEPVTVDDLWHLGSCGKAMTATVAARLVEQGKMNWNTTVAEVFPELAPSFESKLGEVTLTQLLSHRSGLPRDSNYKCYWRLRDYGSASEQRRQSVRVAGAGRLRYPPGSNYLYSGYGYVIAGAMIERITGTSFEEAMRENLFVPLGMSSAVFESPDLVGASKVPRSHSAGGRAARPGRIASSDPAVLRPAGCMRCTLGDWAKFVLHHLRGEQGRSDFLSAETYRRLHTPPYGGEYALGWVVYPGTWAGGNFLAHNGSNRFNFSQVLVAPKKGFAVLICTNQDCSKATDDAAAVLIERFSKGELPLKSRYTVIVVTG